MNNFPEPTSFNGPDTRDMTGHAHPYRCTVCDWTGRGETALRHFRESGHAIRGRDWPKGWPDAQFSAAAAVYARYAFDWELGGITRRMFTIVGGERDRSTVTEETVKALGLPVRQ